MGTCRVSLQDASSLGGQHRSLSHCHLFWNHGCPGACPGGRQNWGCQGWHCPALAVPGELCSCWVVQVPPALGLCPTGCSAAAVEHGGRKSQGWLLFRGSSAPQGWQEALEWGSTSPFTECSFNSTLTTSPSVFSRCSVGWLEMQLGHMPVCSQLFLLLCSL